MVGIVTAVWGMLSGPMAEMGVREVVIKLLGMKIVQAEREGAHHHFVSLDCHGRHCHRDLHGDGFVER